MLQDLGCVGKHSLDLLVRNFFFFIRGWNGMAWTSPISRLRRNMTLGINRRRLIFSLLFPFYPRTTLVGFVRFGSARLASRCSLGRGKCRPVVDKGAVCTFLASSLTGVERARDSSRTSSIIPGCLWCAILLRSTPSRFRVLRGRRDIGSLHTFNLRIGWLVAVPGFVTLLGYRTMGQRLEFCKHLSMELNDFLAIRC